MSSWVLSFLFLLGDGVVAGVLLRKSKAENWGWIVITAGSPFAVICGVFTAIAYASPELHDNPAVTRSLAWLDGASSLMISEWLRFAVWKSDNSRFAAHEFRIDDSNLRGPS